MRYSNSIKNQAISLRNQGYSFDEITTYLKLSQSTIYYWTSKIILNKYAQERILSRRQYGRDQTKLFFKNKRIVLNKIIATEIAPIFIKVPLTKELAQIYCSLLFWAEGSKILNTLKFTNSDPKMIKYFLHTLRRGFEIDEKKLRVNLHLHEYHDEAKMIQFWSSTTQISASQFWKTYLKPHTSKRKHEDYPGTCCVTYFDTRIARTLNALYNTIAQDIGP